MARFSVLVAVWGWLAGCSGGSAVEAVAAGADAGADTQADQGREAGDDGGASSTEADASAPEHPLLADRLLTIAHRGGAGLRPEETMLAYENAASLGIDVLEVDVHHTADAVIVCMHDTNVARTTEGSGEIADMTFAELRALDAAYHFTTDGGQTFPYRGQGVAIPTMGELLTAFPDAPFVIEIKPNDLVLADALIALLDEQDAIGRVGVGSVHHEVMVHVREQRPDLLTGFDALEQAELLLLNAADDPAYTAPATLLQTRYLSVDAGVLATTRRLGVKVQVWTVNAPEDMQAMIDLGVDGIMTDDPATLVALVEGR